MRPISQILLFLFLLPLLASATACARPVYADGIACTRLTEDVSASLWVDGGWEPYGDEHFRYSFPEADGFDDYSAVYSVSTEDINEVGVFHAKSEEDAHRLRDLCEAYLLRKQEEERAFIASYAPEELTKLDAAEVRILGKYVVYTVLTPKDRDTLFAAIADLLRP